MGKRPTFPAWQLASTVTVAVGVAFSVLLMSLAYGVSSDIERRLKRVPAQQTRLVNVDLINHILVLLTAVIIGVMLIQTAVTTFTLGVTVMRSRREEIAIRRQSGVLRSRLLREFVGMVIPPCVVGGLAGELAGLICAGALTRLTVLPVRLTPVSMFAAFPTTILLTLIATLIPAWNAANASPALLRKE